LGLGIASAISGVGVVAMRNAAVADGTLAQQSLNPYFVKNPGVLPKHISKITDEAYDWWLIRRQEHIPNFTAAKETTLEIREALKCNNYFYHKYSSDYTIAFDLDLD
jgi:hypothetical protein